jgi:penicillin-binding protein A
MSGGLGLRDGYGMGGGARRRRPIGTSITRVGLVIAFAFGALAGGAGWWQVVESPSLSSAPDNPAVVAAGRRAVRGEIVDRTGEWLARSDRDANGEPFRIYRSTTLSPVVGYSSQQFGSAGLERAYDAQLIGLLRPDPVADLLKKFEDDPFDPQRLTLSLSLELQNRAYRMLGDQSGAVVIIDPKTGEIITLASTPVYDAGAIANPATSARAFEAIRTDSRQPLLPRATQGLYVPGSVFKIVTGLAALDSGAITPRTTFEEQPGAERGGLLVEGFRVRDAHHLFTGSKALNFAEGTEVSCNIYYALAGLEAGPEGLAEMAGRLGFGAPIPFDLPTSVSQLTNGGGNFGAGFSDAVELANAAYGQGETLVTPLQMALVAAAVANDGVLMKPHLVTAMTGRESGTRTIAPETLRRVTTPETAREVQLAMQLAVEGDLGRRFTPGADVPGVEVAGKSGTAELDGGANPHSWFIGFAPVDDPQVAIAVVVEGGGRGGIRAAPMFGDILELALAELAE